MKTLLQAAVISSLILMTSCVEMAVGTAIVATGCYIADQGYIYEYFDRSYDSSWQVMDQHVQSLRGNITYRSKNAGVIDIDFEESGSARFKIEKITKRATKVSIKCYRRGVPSNNLAQEHFPSLAQQML